MALAALVGILAVHAAAQQPAPSEQLPAENLSQVEARLAERYERLELLAGRLAELSRSTQPRRAKLLRDLIASSRERDVTGQFKHVVTALDEQRYSTAIESEAALQADLEKLLNLLLEEDRDRQLESQRKRISRYLQDLNRLLRLQRGVKARTEGGDDAPQLADDQGRVGGNTKKLADQIAQTEGTDKKQSAPGKDKPKSPPQHEQQGEPGQQGQPGQQDQPPDQGQQGQPSKPSQPSGSPSEGQSASRPGQGSQDRPEPSPIEKASERLKRAQQRMQRAQQQLEEAKRTGAAQDQQRAIDELEQAKAELEHILRQLREEELERMLVLLEARFRKMLDEQVEVYDGTRGLDKSSTTLAAHELEIASARLSRKERLIVSEADRALVLLREDGTSAAFPEAVEQAREDMQTIAERLNETKVDKLTQRIEEDVIAALEETLAALRQTLDQLRDQRPPTTGRRRSRRAAFGGPIGRVAYDSGVADARQSAHSRVRRNDRRRTGPQVRPARRPRPARRAAGKNLPRHAQHEPERQSMNAAVRTIVLALALPAAAAYANVDFPPSWQPPTYEQVRGEVSTWRGEGGFSPEVAAQVTKLWPVRRPPPASESDLLDRLAQTFAAVYPQAEQLVRSCEADYAGPALPDAAWLASGEAPAFVRNNLRLYYARWLAQHGLYDEALAELDGLKLAEVVDPASLLFYRMVAYQQLVQPDDARAALVQLMEQKERLPQRFQHVAQLVERDLAGLDDESLDHIARRMNDVRRRLDYGRAGEHVQQIEKGVVDSLDKKIDKLEKQQQQQNQQAQQGGSAQPSQPMQDSRLPGMKAPMKVDQRDIGHTAGWGDLPPKERERALQQIGRDFPAHYRDLIEQYFRQLANEPEQPQDK